VRTFVEHAAEAAGFRITWEGEGLEEVGRDQDGRVIVRVNPEFHRPAADLTAILHKAPGT
jgi:GDPmannose 4,6-dehydratase